MKPGFMSCSICGLEINGEEATRFVITTYNAVTHKDLKRTTFFLCDKCLSATKTKFEDALESVKEDRESEEYWMN